MLTLLVTRFWGATDIVKEKVDGLICADGANRAAFVFCGKGLQIDARTADAPEFGMPALAVLAKRNAKAAVDMLHAR